MFNLVSIKKSLIIIGASGHGKVIAEIAKKRGYKIKFWDDNPFNNKQKGSLIIESRSSKIPVNTKLIIGIGDNSIREKVSKEYNQNDFITLIHPKSIVSQTTKIGNGSIIMGGSSLGSNLIIGKHCILNTSCVVEHDCIIGDFVHISPNSTICGNVSIGNRTWVGTGAIIIQNITVGKNVTIGAGAVIINNIPDGVTVVGNPSRIIKESL